MQNTEILRNKILSAREKRALLRSEIPKEYPYSLSLSLNIAGYPKTNDTICDFFEIILNQLKRFLTSERISLAEDTEQKIIDDAGNFYLTGIRSDNLSGEEIKQKTERFEFGHPLGRLIDVDICDSENNFISSGKLKTCFYCGRKPAIECMREKMHSYEDMRNKFLPEMKTYILNDLREKRIAKISSLALKAVLYEISLSPKPGLVDFFNSGTHTDMDYFTFIDSSSAISPYFKEFAEVGYDFSESAENALPAIRKTGLKAEKAMFDATDNVNTQKGIIFLMGLSIFSVANILANSGYYDEELFRKKVIEICSEIVKNELEDIDETNPTHGEKMFKKYGNKGAGARMEAQTGFASVFQSALPFFNEALKKDTRLNKDELINVMTEGLLRIMSINNDSNVLFRGGEEKLNILKKISEKAVTDNIQYQNLTDYCKNNSLSPGGSADLLSISLFLQFIKNEFSKH